MPFAADRGQRGPSCSTHLQLQGLYTGRRFVCQSLHKVMLYHVLVFSCSQVIGCLQHTVSSLEVQRCPLVLLQGRSLCSATLKKACTCDCMGVFVQVTPRQAKIKPSSMGIVINHDSSYQLARQTHLPPVSLFTHAHGVSLL